MVLISDLRRFLQTLNKSLVITEVIPKLIATVGKVPAHTTTVHLLLRLPPPVMVGVKEANNKLI